jgi:MFS family permease
LGHWLGSDGGYGNSFWAVTIFGVTVQILFYFAAAETYAPRILYLKAQKLRKETGNTLLHTPYESEDRRLGPVLRRSMARVFVLLGTQPIVQFLALYMALQYGIIYLMLATYPQVWTGIYYESVGIGGLNYISLIIGLTAGAQTSGYFSDRVYRALTARAPNREGRPEFRVPLLFLAIFLLASGLLIYGWGAQYRVHWIVPNIGAVIFGIGTTMVMTCLQTYTLDCYQLYAASAVGAAAVARSLTGFAFPLFADYMFEALGEGWGNSVLALSMLVIGYAGGCVLWFYGWQLRARSQYAADK